MEYVAVLLPSVAIGVVFYVLMRWAFRADSAERKARSTSEDDARRWYEEIRQREGDGEIFQPRADKDS
ncbi:hypothetical protein D8M21_06415 [Kocuria sp. HSID16901]|nr:hypothetical protein D8M21_06415 [Kocuria sp. HSID16901]